MADGDTSGSADADGGAGSGSSTGSGWADVGRAAHHLFTDEEAEAERFGRSARIADDQARLDAEFDEAQLPDSVIPELTDDGVVDPWGGQGVDDQHESGGGAGPGSKPPSPGVLVAAAAAALGLVGALTWSLIGGDDETPSTVDAVTVEDTTATQADVATDESNEALESVDADPEDAPVGADDTQRWEATPTDGWAQFDDFDEIVRERARDGVVAGDALDVATIVSAYVSSDGFAKTEVGVEFVGAAEAVQAEDSANLDGGIGFVGSDGSYVDILWYDDGTTKVSDSPAAWSIEALWKTPEKLLVIIEGVGVVPGEAVAVTVFLEVFGGVNVQTIEIPTG